MSETSDFTIDPIKDVSDAFNAKYKGHCGLLNCERHQVIQLGDVCQYVLGDLMHMVCARRFVRGHVGPFCEKCVNYHDGACA